VLALRLALVAFVLAWIFDLLGIRSFVPFWLPFAIALALEVTYFAGALRASSPRERDRGPQEIDLKRYGYLEDDEDEPQPRRAGTRFAVGLAVIAALAGIAWYAGRSDWERLDADARSAATQRFSAEASRIVGRPVEVRCDESGKFVGAVQHADGVAEVGGRRAYLTPERCYDLYRLAFEGEISFSQTARAIAVLAHEAWHLHGERNEGITECYALQSGVSLGRRLGLRDETARRMMRQQLAENSLRGRGDIEYLVPPECRDGGALDLDARSPDFP
jgi:hypothetical protein